MRMHYRNDLGSALCGAQGSEWVTFVPGAVTCPECQAHLVLLGKVKR